MNQDIRGAGYILIINNDPATREAVSSYFSTASRFTSPSHGTSHAKLAAGRLLRSLPIR
jgi:hypothetical protein